MYSETRPSNGLSWFVFNLIFCRGSTLENEQIQGAAPLLADLEGNIKENILVIVL